jgi:hypothetical protein
MFVAIASVRRHLDKAESPSVTWLGLLLRTPGNRNSREFYEAIIDEPCDCSFLFRSLGMASHVHLMKPAYRQASGRINLTKERSLRQMSCSNFCNIMRQLEWHRQVEELDP